MSTWAEYWLAWALFLSSHALPIRKPIKARLVKRLGQGGFTLAYSAVSLAALTWLIVAAGRAPWWPLWDAAPWQRGVTQGAMLLACIIVALAVFAPNPLSFGGWRNDSFNPERSGIVAHLRHPLLAALALWSAGHIPPNGNLAQALMFAGFAGFALLGMVMIDRRRRRDMGAQTWQTLARARASLPRLWLLRLVGGIALWAALVWLHPLIIGPVVWP